MHVSNAGFRSEHDVDRSTNDFVCVDYLGERTLGTSRLLETQTPPVTAATSSGLHHKSITAASCKAPRYSFQL